MRRVEDEGGQGWVGEALVNGYDNYILAYIIPFQEMTEAKIRRSSEYGFLIIVLKTTEDI
jgi:hypothetical protein